MLKGCESHLKEIKPNDVTIDIQEKEAVFTPTDSTEFVENEVQPEETGKPLETTLQQSFIPLLTLPVRKDTISAKVPEGINIEDIYQQHVEIQE